MRQLCHVRLEQLAPVALGLLIVAAAITLAPWKPLHQNDRPASVRDMPSGEFLALDVLSDSAAIDLDFREGTRYVLVVSSLADGLQTHSVQLETKPIAARVVHSAHRLCPFRPQRLHPLPANTSVSAPSARTASDADKAVSPSTERDFFLHVTDGDLNDPDGYARVSAQVVAEGRDVRVYLDKAQRPGDLAPGVTEQIVRVLDDEIIPNYRRVFGVYRDIDGDGKFAVLLTPWLERLQGGRTAIGGFVRGGDFRKGKRSPFSNHCDMLYLNSNATAGAHLRNLLTHEYAHAVCLSERLPSTTFPRGLPDEEDWLNESIAHQAEHLYGQGFSNLDYRISSYLAAPNEFPLVVRDYYRAGMWRNHGCRGATYLFLSWCVQEHGIELLRDLVTSPATGRRSLEWATGMRFDELYRQWTISLLELDNSMAQEASESEPGSDGKSHSASLPGYAKLCLHEPLGTWGLAGPRCIPIDVDQPAREFTLRGTSTMFLELTVAGKPGPRRIHLRGDYGCDLQVSLMKRSDDWPSIEIQSAELVQSDSDGTAASFNSASFRSATLDVRLTGNGNSTLRVSSLSVERQAGQPNRSVCFAGDVLRRYQTESTTASDNDWQFRVPLPRGDSAESSVVWLVKVVAVDEQGRYAAAWKELEQPASIQVAAQAP